MMRAMDLLSDILEQAGARGRLLDLRALAEAAVLEFPCDRSIGLHVVLRGRARLEAEGLAAPLLLEAGDVAVMARGRRHRLAVDPAPEAGGGAGALLICGAYLLPHAPVHPFFAEIPDWSLLRGGVLPDAGPLARAVDLLAAEKGQAELGGDAVARALLDVIFGYALRELVARSGRTAAGWSHAVADPKIRAVLALLQADCAAPWTLERMAEAAGLSRTALAERFRAAMADTPLAHLRTLRVQRAMRLLAESDMALERIAREVGYGDAFGFSKAFKRVAGVAPSAFRRRARAEAEGAPAARRGTG
jgi:AraC-like DNA-binding protein